MTAIVPDAIEITPAFPCGKNRDFPRLGFNPVSERKIDVEQLFFGMILVSASGRLARHTSF